MKSLPLENFRLYSITILLLENGTIILTLLVCELTWDLASIDSVHCWVYVFQNLIVLSLLPPPVASRFGCHGHQAMAYKTGEGKSMKQGIRGVYL